MKSVQVLFLVLALTNCGIRFSRSDSPLVLDYYEETCPDVEDIVRRIVEIAVLRDPCMAASLLRLHFHDCFVMGCDGSVLLDNYWTMLSEKQAGPNLNSLRGFEVIDETKCILEEACPVTVSCADILALAARDAVVLRGGPEWGVALGRKDSLTASFNGANQFIPAPNSTLNTLIANFQQQGLDMGDLVALSVISNGKYRSIEHRAMVNFQKERLSIAAFHSPNMRTKIERLPHLLKENGAKYITLKHEKYLRFLVSNKLDGKSLLNQVRINQ